MIDLPAGVCIGDSRHMDKVASNSVTLVVTCYSEDTEILTRRCWKLFRELTNDDEVATIDENHVMSYSMPNAIQKSRYIGEMIKISHRSVDLLVTPNHNLYLRKNKEIDYGFIKAIDFPPRGANTISNIHWNAHDVDYFCLPPVEINNGYYTESSGTVRFRMDDWMEFFGWYISEGSLNKNHYTIQITQIKDDYKEEIGVCLSRLGYKWSYTSDKDFRIFSKQLYAYLAVLGKSYEKYIPQEFMLLSKRQLKILFDAIVKGDGCVDKSTGRTRIYTASKKLADQLQEMSIKLGFNATISTRDRRGERHYLNGRIVENKKIEYIINILSSAGCYLFPRHFRTTEYDGFVYCCTVPSHVILVRKNGKAVWCGNSPPYNVNLEYERGQSFDDWILLISAVLKECDRVMIDGGRACINIAATGRKPYKPMYKYIIDIAEDLGWWMRGTVLWIKGVSRASTAWGSWKSATNPELRDNHEFILIFNKGKDSIEPGITKVGTEEFMEITNAEWYFSPESATSVGHPAPFPDELPRRCITLLSNEGDLVLDPFAGSGTTLKVAKILNRRGITYELNESYIPIMWKRLEEKLDIRCKGYERDMEIKRDFPGLCDKATRELVEMAKKLGIRDRNAMTRIALMNVISRKSRQPSLDDFR